MYQFMDIWERYTPVKKAIKCNIAHFFILEDKKWMQHHLEI